jgi:hypothetical protein
MRFHHVQLAIAASVAALLFCGSGAGAQEEKRNLRSYRRALLELPRGSVVELPTGHAYPFRLHVAERKGKTFTGTLTYDLGLREQVFEVEGTINQGRLTFVEKRARIGHPHSPSLGDGKFEIDTAAGSGVAHLYLPRWTTSRLAYGAGPVECKVRFRWD